MAKHNPRINRQSYRRIRRNRRIAGTILIIILLALVALILFGVARLVTKDKPADSESSAVSSSVRMPLFPAVRTISADHSPCLNHFLIFSNTGYTSKRVSVIMAV